MPKTYSQLYEQIISFENLYLAYCEARRGRRYRGDVLRFHQNHEETLLNLHKELKAKTWQPGPYREFLCTTEVKRRVIHAPAFIDRVVHHALANVTRPLFEKKYIFDSYATINGKGTHKAVFRVQEFMRRAGANWDTVYVLQCDISKYYPSMDHDVLMEQIKRTIRDKDALWLWRQVIAGFNDDTGRGLPIGALTSQIAANIYLNVLDHFVKECMQVKYYVRYMDDFVLLGPSKEYLWDALADIKWLLEGHLKLKLNPKTKIYPASRGVDFAGYRTFTTHMLPRKRNIKAAKKRFQNLSKLYSKGMVSMDRAKASVMSFLGYVKHCQARRTTLSTLSRLTLTKKGGLLNGKNSPDINDNSQPD